MTAPVAVIRTTACSDQRHRAAAMSLTPSFQILVQADALPVWPRLFVQIRDQRTWRGSHHVAFCGSKVDAVDRRPLLRITVRTEKCLNCNLSFPCDHDVGPVCKILFRIVCWFRTSEYYLPAAISGVSCDLDGIPPGHEVCVQSKSAGFAVTKQAKELILGAERRVVDVDLEAQPSQVRRKIQDA